MDLANLVNNLFWDYLYVEGSGVLDSVTTYLGIKKHGADLETNLIVREGVKKEGTAKYLLKEFFYWSVKGACILGLAYSLDCVLGIEKSYLNIHHTLAYSNGTLGYLTAIRNLAVSNGWTKTADAMAFVGIPDILVGKIVYRLTGKQIGDYDTRDTQ